MTTLGEIDFTDEEFELLQRAVKSLGNTEEVLDSILEGMTPPALRSRSHPDQVEKKEKAKKLEEQKITLQYKLIQLKKYLKQPMSVSASESNGVHKAASN
jgi:hypothetical protein